MWPIHTKVLQMMMKCVYACIIQVHSMYTSKCKYIYQILSLLTHTKQSSNPWGLQIAFFINCFSTAVAPSRTSCKQQSHERGQAKEKNNSSAALVSSTNPPRGHPLLLLVIMLELPSRQGHNNNGDSVQYSLLVTTSQLSAFPCLKSFLL
jgi:hypothetical protein